MPSLNIYNTNDMKDIACKYAKALYKCIPNAYRNSDILSVCNGPIDVTPLPTTEDPPLEWGLADVLGGLPDFIFAWGPNWEPENNMIKDVLGGPLDKPSELICPVAIEPGWTGDAGYLRQMIAYYKHLITARTYYINICAASKLYTSYRMYIDTLSIGGSPWDWSSAINLSMDNGGIVQNVFDPNDLLNYWKLSYNPSVGPTFSEWLWGRYIGIYGPETQKCADGLDIFDAIVPFAGIGNIFNISNTDTWWQNYSVTAPVSPNLGSSNNSIGISEKKFITTNIQASPPISIPAYRISWEDMWYPFLNNSQLQGSIVDFSEAIVLNMLHGPTLITGSNITCEPIGVCCVDGVCTAYQSECQTILKNGTFIPDVECDPLICISPTPTVTPTYTSTPTYTPSYTPTHTITPSITSTITTTPSITPTITTTPSITPTITTTPSITPTITATPSLSSAYCNCSIITQQICNNVFSSVGLYYSSGGIGTLGSWYNEGNIPKIFPGTTSSFTLGLNGNNPTSGGSIGANAEITCDMVGQKANIILKVTLTGDGSQYCDSDLTIPFTSAIMKYSLLDLECDSSSYVDIAGNYSLNLDSINPIGCSAGISTTWNINHNTQCP